MRAAHAVMVVAAINGQLLPYRESPCTSRSLATERAYRRLCTSLYQRCTAARTSDHCIRSVPRSSALARHSSVRRAPSHQTATRSPHRSGSLNTCCLPAMSLLPTSNGVAYLPDGQGLPPPRPWPTWVRALLFLACYASLQALYAQCAGTGVERFFLETLASRPAAAVIDGLQPDLTVRAVGTRVTALAGGGINIANGCEGTDLYILLLAAFVCVPLTWRSRVLGLGLGLGLAFVLNLTRIVALFHAYRSDHAWFNTLHTMVAPVLLVLFMILYFHAWLHYCTGPAKKAD